MTIIEFLQARITEDEQEAKACLAQYQRGDGGSKRRWVRMLDECEAKREIVNLCTNSRSFTDAHTAPIIRALASVYNNHLDYQEEWRTNGF